MRADPMTKQASERRQFTLVACIALVTLAGLAGCGKRSDGNAQRANGAANGLALRIGYGKGGAADIVRRQGTLEKRLAPLGVRVSWLQFPMGPQMMEAIGAGSLDIGAAASTPPIFAQAAGVPFVYAANTPPGKPFGAVLVPQNSPIHSLRDLKGKRIAFQPGSVWQYDLVKLLEQVGLEYSDIQPIKLPPADASSAFASGSIDAWVQGEPYITLATRKSGARVLVDTSGVPNDGGFYLAAATTVKAHPELIRTTLEELKKAGDWSLAHPHDAAVLTASDVGLDVETLEKTYTQANSTTFRPIDEAIIRQQQDQADLFLKLGVLPKPIDVRKVALSPEQYARLLPKPETGNAGKTASAR
jgi:sulfonate transport system substrate-binding protein